MSLKFLMVPQPCTQWKLNVEVNENKAVVQEAVNDAIDAVDAVVNKVGDKPMTEEQQKIFARTAPVFKWISMMPPPDAMHSVIVSIVNASNRLDGKETPDAVNEVIKRWAGDVCQQLEALMFFIRGHLTATLDKDNEGDEVLNFNLSTLGEKFVSLVSAQQMNGKNPETKECQTSIHSQQG